LLETESFKNIIREIKKKKMKISQASAKYSIPRITLQMDEEESPENKRTKEVTTLSWQKTKRKR